MLFGLLRIVEKTEKKIWNLMSKCNPIPLFFLENRSVQLVTHYLSSLQIDLVD